MEIMNAQERIFRTILGLPVDRTPIFSPLTWNPTSPLLDGWKASSNYRQLVEATRNVCDFYAQLEIPESVPFRNQKTAYGLYGTPEGIFDRRFFLTHPDCIEVCGEEQQGEKRLVRYKMHTPRGTLTTVDAIVAGEDTVWEYEPLVKCPDDVATLLSAPSRFDPPDLAKYEADRQLLADRGVAVCFITSPMVMISRITGFQQFLEWTITEPGLIERLIRTVQERTAERLQHILGRGAGPVFRFGGCEQATPPMMSSRSFDKFIIGYEAPLWKLVQDAEKIVWVHCHGRVSTVIDRFIDHGVQLLDPVEPPPQGDITIEQAKQKAAGHNLALIGNIEWLDMENADGDTIEQRVKSALEDGGKDHLILGTSSEVLHEVNDQLRDNVLRYLEAGIRYGTRSSSEQPCTILI